MTNNTLTNIIYVLVISLLVFLVSEVFAGDECVDLANSCEDTIISQSITINQCKDIVKEQDTLIEKVKEQTTSAEKSLDTQKTLTTTGFSLSSLLLLLLIL